MLDSPRTSARYVAGRPPPLTVNTEPTHSGHGNVHVQSSQEASIRSPGIELRPGVCLLASSAQHNAVACWQLTTGLGDLDDLDSTQLEFYPNLALDPAALPTHPPPSDEHNGWGDAEPSEHQRAVLTRPPRRQALSGMNSPRAPGKSGNMQAMSHSPDSPLAPLTDMLDSPRLSAMQTAAPPVAYQPLTEVIATRATQRWLMSGIGAGGGGIKQAAETQPEGRALWLRLPSRPSSALGSRNLQARTGHDVESSGANRLDAGLSTQVAVRGSAARETEQRASWGECRQMPPFTPADCTVQVPRRKALSGCASPRAPDMHNLKAVDQPEECMSPLVPLQNMMSTPATSPDPIHAGPSLAQQQKSRTARNRRQALSGPDSPRAPAEPAASLAAPQPQRQHVTPTPLAPLRDMIDSPRTSASYVAEVRSRGVE